MNMKTGILIGVAGVGAIAAGVVYSGAYNVAADEPHWNLTARAIRLVRDRSIAMRAAGLTVPDLADPERIAVGAEHYAAMCTGCHLAPGVEDSELRAGLYPTPPNLAEHGGHRTPAETFWIVKHGLRMTGMAAWGTTHDDDSLWGIVAFLQQLPKLDAAAYARMVGDKPPGGEGQDDHEHHGNSTVVEGRGAEPAGAAHTPTHAAGEQHGD